MSATIQHEEGSTWQLRVTGVMKKAELDSALAQAREEIARAGKIRVLLVLDGFEGWEKGADWADMTFVTAHGDDIEKIAVVADPGWETEVLMFLGAGFRRTQVKFFVTGGVTQARAWLKEDAVTGSVTP